MKVVLLQCYKRYSFTRSCLNKTSTFYPVFNFFGRFPAEPLTDFSSVEQIDLFPVCFLATACFTAFFVSDEIIFLSIGLLASDITVAMTVDDSAVVTEPADTTVAVSPTSVTVLLLTEIVSSVSIGWGVLFSSDFTSGLSCSFFFFDTGVRSVTFFCGTGVFWKGFLYFEA